MRKNAKFPKVLGKRIKKFRKRAGLTQEELAERILISRVYMGYLEQGRNIPSLEVLNRIGRILKIPLSEFLD